MRVNDQPAHPHQPDNARREDPGSNIKAPPPTPKGALSPERVSPEPPAGRALRRAVSASAALRL